MITQQDVHLKDYYHISFCSTWFVWRFMSVVMKGGVNHDEKQQLLLK